MKAAGMALAAVAVAGVAVVLFTVLRPRSVASSARPQPQACPPVSSSLKADVDGDGCPSAVERSGNTLEVEGKRYQLGQVGDTVLIGDWDCDGRDTPALYRPGGSVFFFDAWADEGAPLPPVSSGQQLAEGRPEVQPGEDGCDHVVVR